MGSYAGAAAIASPGVRLRQLAPLSVPWQKYGPEAHALTTAAVPVLDIVEYGACRPEGCRCARKELEMPVLLILVALIVVVYLLSNHARRVALARRLRRWLLRN